jgi:uncharacterized protein (TIRG00374 family)
LTSLAAGLDAKRPRKVPWSFVAKAIVTVAVFVILFNKIGLRRCLDALSQADGLWVAIAFVSNALGLLISAWKWQRLLRALGGVAHYVELTRLYTISFFMSAFMPGIVGGDVARGYLAGPRAGGHLKVAASILVERATGLVMLIVLSFLALLFGGTGLGTPPVLVFVVSILLAVIVALALGLNRRLGTLITYRTRRTRIRRIMRQVHRLQRTLRRLPTRPLLEALFWSVGFYASVALTMYLICVAFGTQISFLEATVVQLLINLVTLLPITVAGLGTVQAADVYLLGLLGIRPGLALAMSLVRLIFYYGYAVIGGFVFLHWRTVVPDSRLSERKVHGLR